MQATSAVSFGTVAYFSMEIGLEPSIPTYSGGLGILAGDTLRSAADLGVSMVGITLVHRKGYFRQQLDVQGNQKENPDVWKPEDILKSLEPQVAITIEGREVKVRVWRYDIQGLSGQKVPVYFLDTALPENSPWDQTLTDHLYGGDHHYRLCQEVVLGMGGMATLTALGITDQVTYHMNEGHSALLALSLLEAQRRGGEGPAPTEGEVEAVRRHCVFTTHTPVPAGHDQFPWELVSQVLGQERAALLEATGCCIQENLNMTYLALRFARYINGVAMRHGEISLGMFPGYPINAISNGVHAVTWTSPSFSELFDRRIPEWQKDNFYLRYAVGIALHEIAEAHAHAKRTLLAEVERQSGVRLPEHPLTIGFARRATAYKRPDLFLFDLERLKAIALRVGPLQVIYGGKAHPRDEGGQEMIRRVFQAARTLGEDVKIIYLENYDMALGKILCAGVDLWLNTPLRPQEASGTSGMKAALNGVPSLSILDGWWVEGHVEHITGWAIGGDSGNPEEHHQEAALLYNKLEQVILPLYYVQPEAYDRIRRSAIALNGSFFNTQRMVSQYVANAYLPNNWTHDR